jgi:hypothetical protein
MKLIKNYKKFLLKENVDMVEEPSTEIAADIHSGGDMTLYRLTSHPVVDLSAPGEYYVKSLEDVSPEFLDEKGDGDYFLITVKCPSDNIDMEKSEEECAKHNCDCIVAIKDDSRCEVVSVEPHKI